MFIKTFGYILIALCFSVFTSFAQSVHTDTLLYSNTAKQVIQYFNTSIAEQAELYNGAKYEPFSPFATKGTVYFQNKNLCEPGAVRYNGFWYKDIPVLYDAYNDDMVASLDGNLFILKSEKINDIYVLGHHFIFIIPTNSYNLKGGYYDLMYDGKTQVMVKRVKATIENVIGQQTVEVNYVDAPAIFVKKDNSYIQVKSRGDFLDLFPAKKKELKKYFKANKLDYRDNADIATAKLAGYYDTINK